MAAGARSLDLKSSGTSSGEAIQLRRGGDLATGIDIWEYGGNSYIDTYYNSTSSQLNFRTQTGGTPITAMTILGSGNVGIGTTTPGPLLNTYGANVIFQVPQYNGNLQIQPLAGTARDTLTLGTQPYWPYIESGDGMYFYVNGSTTTPAMTLYPTGLVGIGTNVPLSSLSIAGNLALGAYGGGASTTAAPSNGLIVSGNVGIGTTSPGAKLQVNGGAAIGYSTSTAAPSNGLISATDRHRHRVARFDGIARYGIDLARLAAPAPLDRERNRAGDFAADRPCRLQHHEQ